MNLSRAHGFAAVLLGALALTPSLALAQSPNRPPRSPYALPQPTYHERDPDDAGEGADCLYSGQAGHGARASKGGYLLKDLADPNGRHYNPHCTVYDDDDD